MSNELMALADELIELLWSSPEVTWRKPRSGVRNAYLAIPADKVQEWRDRWKAAQDRLERRARIQAKTCPCAGDSFCPGGPFCSCACHVRDAAPAAAEVSHG